MIWRLGFLVALVLAILWVVKLTSQVPDQSAGVDEDPTGEAASGQTSSSSSLRVLSKSWFEMEYGTEDTTTIHDLEIVSSTLTESQTMIKDFTSYFLPDNAAITAFLSGGNRDRLAWIRPGHKAIGRDGELMDRFGTPLFFHRETGTRFQIRSAGNDRTMWTDDDVVYPKSTQGKRGN